MGVAATALMATLALTACGGEQAPSERESVSVDPSAEAATVNGQTIYVSDVEMEARMKGLIRDNERLEPESVEFNEILDQLIEIKLLAMEALSRGLDEEPEAQHRLQTARDNILGNILLEHIADDKVDDAAIRKMYDAQVQLLVLGDEAHVRHILAPTKDAIDKIVAELRGGAEFSVLAAKRSTDQATRMDGGDLGYMTADDATPEFAKVIRETPSGGISRPFEDQMGWHVVKIDEVRKESPPSLEELRGPIVQFLRRTQLEEILKQLRGEAEINKKTSPRNSRLDAPVEPKPAPAKPAAAAPAPAVTTPSPALATPAPATPSPSTAVPAAPPLSTEAPTVITPKPQATTPPKPAVAPPASAPAATPAPASQPTTPATPQ
ncbi:MAG TPA: peptidylprolyl isomerase [Hyphomonadaceae bacterium]|jgi:peptidyl-prolyl cis-trans isomerase C|nr:peptidylprolyl isomerase [Hyphomonadaceae bacterium]